MISALIKRMSIKLKLLVLCIAMMLPAILLLNLYNKIQTEKIQVAVLEKQGSQLIKELLPVYLGFLEHRAAYNNLFLGEASFQTKVAAIENEVNKAFESVQKLNQTHHAFDFISDAKKIEEQWKHLVQNNAKLTKTESFDRHGELLEELISFIGLVTEKTGLALDPEAHTYYLMNTATSDIPNLIDHLDRVRALSFEAAKTGQVSEQVKMLLFSSKHDVGDLTASVLNSFSIVFETDSRLKADFQGLLQQLEGHINQTYDLGKEVLESNGGPFSFTTKEAFDRGTVAVDQAAVLSKNSLEKLNFLLDERIARETKSRNSSLGFSFGLFILVAIFGVLVQRRIQEGLDVLKKGFSSIENNQFDQLLPVVSKDEIGQSIVALNQVLQVLSKNACEALERNRAALIQQDKERIISEENARVRKALDTVASNTMLVDINYNIIYMNHSLKSMFSDVEPDFKKAFNNFEAKNLLGKSIDIFYSNPMHQRAMMDNLRGANKTEVVMGSRTMILNSSPVLDEAGQRIGSVIEWFDRTQEVIIEKEINDLVENASAGDLTSRISERGKEGFSLCLSQGLNQLVGVMEKVIEDTSRVLSALAHGSLTESIEGSYQGAFQKLKDDANMTVEKLTEIISNIRQISREVSSGAQEIAQGNADLSQRTEEQASSLEETASSMEEMTATVKQTADNAQSAKSLAVVAKETAQHGGNVVSEAVSAMSGINESSKKIADIIGVIDEIAFQTNLLALNAAVEAARAGDQGRGFAVVAGEVRNLAQRSAAAAKEIKELIRDSVNKVQNGSDLVNKSGSTLQEIVRSVEKVAGTIAEISNAAQEQRSGIAQVNTAITQIDTMTQQNSALVEEAFAASEAMAGQARKLLEMVSFFTLSDLGDERSAADSSRRASPGKSQKRTASAGKVMRPGEGKEEWSEF